MGKVVKVDVHITGTIEIDDELERLVASKMKTFVADTKQVYSLPGQMNIADAMPRRGRPRKARPRFP